jgi:hypothetical protein
MSNEFHLQKSIQLIIGFFIGISFGFLLHKGGVTHYDVIVGQLLLTDFTVVKIMLSAVVSGMIGIYFLKSIGAVALHPKPGAFGSTVIGGLIFGVGFGILGYCPGTLAGAIGQGSLDALFGGLIGVLIGAGLFATFYPNLDKYILNKGDFGEITWPQLLKVNPWVLVIPISLGIVALLWWIEKSGL